jgi:beta-mannosidase
MDNIIHQSLDGPWKLVVIHHDVFLGMELPVTYDGVIGAGAKSLGGKGAIDAAVPGNFEISLEQAGIIKDPFFGKNLLDMLAYEDCHVFYARKFDYTPVPGTRPEFIFEGLDTIADLYLNGKFLAHRENMFITHRIRDLDLRNGGNELVVHLLPVCIETRKNQVSAGLVAQRYNWETLRLRKAPSMFGWDITPRLVSAGIYRSAGVYLRPAESFRQVYLMTVSADARRNTAVLELFFEVDIGEMPLDGYRITVQGKCGGGETGGVSEFFYQDRLWFTAGKYRFDAENIKLWWPKNYGKPNLYDVTVTLEKNGEERARYETRFGIRTVKLRRTGTTDMFFSGKFYFEINGRRVFVMGTNWVPVDAYHSRDKSRIPEIMKLLEDIGCNGVRCWGGNVYEDPVFYRACDEMGIMVWQDFAMACAVHPLDGEFRSLLREEAVSVVRALRQHPSIILWAGDNEIDRGIEGDGYGRNPNFNRLTREVLPDVINTEDPVRPFIPSSPYYDEEAAKLFSREYLPENHLWGPRDYYKSNFYKGSLCQFASEIGYHGCVAVKSLKKFISPEKLWPWKDNDEWKIHAASPETDRGSYLYRIELMAKQVRELFGSIPENLEDFALASQISQAEAKKFFVEFFRTGQPNRSGIIWWNLIDGWPQFSDAVVDYYYEKKLAYYYLRQSQRPLLLTFTEPFNWRLRLTAVNNAGDAGYPSGSAPGKVPAGAPLEFTYTVTDYDTKETLLSGTGVCEDQSVFELGSIPFAQGEKKFYLIEWESGIYSGKNHYLSGNPPFNFKEYTAFLKNVYPDWV